MFNFETIFTVRVIPSSHVALLLQISVERIRKKEGLMDVLEAYIQQPHYKEIFINLVS